MRTVCHSPRAQGKRHSYEVKQIKAVVIWLCIVPHQWSRSRIQIRCGDVEVHCHAMTSGLHTRPLTRSSNSLLTRISAAVPFYSDSTYFRQELHSVWRNLKILLWTFSTQPGCSLFSPPRKITDKAQQQWRAAFLLTSTKFRYAIGDDLIPVALVWDHS